MRINAVMNWSYFNNTGTDNFPIKAHPEVSSSTSSTIPFFFCFFICLFVFLIYQPTSCSSFHPFTVTNKVDKSALTLAGVSVRPGFLAVPGNYSVPTDQSESSVYGRREF